MTSPPKLLKVQRPWHFKPEKSASELRNTLRNSDADVGIWMVAKNSSTNVAPRYSITLFHVSIKMSSEEILIKFDVSFIFYLCLHGFMNDLWIKKSAWVARHDSRFIFYNKKVPEKLLYEVGPFNILWSYLLNNKNHMSFHSGKYFSKITLFDLSMISTRD